MEDKMGRFGDNRRSGGFRSNSFGPREMRKAVCDECKQECEVLSYLKDPVLCQECYRKKRPRY